MDAYPAHNAARPRGRRLLKAALAAVASLSLAFAGVALESFTPSAPQAVAGPGTIGATTVGPLGVGAFSGTVPAGICSVTANVVGGAGGSAVTTTTNANGAGANITATYPVLPGWSYSGTVGGGGGRPTGSGTSDTAGPGGSNGGGTGGTSGAVSNIKHHGAGGGGYTDLSFNGTLAVLAGGGGGAGGGHSTGTDGTGGNAGLPTASGVTNGQNGFKGKDYPGTATVTGGTGGSSTAGAGGVNSQSTPANGFAASGRTGGTGGNDTNPDAGGGGGGGYAGGGGGASTLTYNTEFSGAAGSEIAGAGGGGGSSYVAPSTTAGNVSGISSVLGAKITTASSAAGANGSLTLTWNPCTYDLSVAKSVSSAVNGVVTWTVAVTNNGPSPMTQGDTVTITDDVPGAGTKTVTGISTSGGSNTLMVNGAVTCGAIGVGSTLTAPATIDCSRPYQPVGGSVSGVRGLNVGETLTITYTQPISASVTNNVGVTDRPSTTGNNSATATVTPPTAVNDSSLGNALGTPITLGVITNDSGSFGANPVTLWNTGTSTAIASPYVVAGQGTWTVSGTSVTFTPQAGYKGDPTPVTYRVTASNGLTATASVTITYVPVAVNDSRTNLVIGTATTLQPLANDDGDWTVSSLRLMNGATPVTSLTVSGQGVWTVSGADVTFTPQVGFLTDPSPVTYRITDSTGDNATATITLNYVPAAANDSSLGNALGTTVNQNVLANDTGSFTVSTLRFTANNGTTLVVAGEGTWTVQPGGVIRFVPEAGFFGDPAPVGYRVTDTTGDTATATVTVAYVPAAVDDTKLGNALGTDVSVTVLANDSGSFVAGSVRLMDGLLPVTSLVVAGQGTWSVAADIVTFHPEPGYLGDPDPVYYRVTDITGDNVSATVTITYDPVAVDDFLGGLTIGSAATVHPLANDAGSWNASTLRLIDPATLTAVTGPVVVAGQGTWTISGTDIVFTPAVGFQVDPDPIGYRITDVTGDVVSAQITLDYVPAAADDAKTGNALGTTVDVNALANDTGVFTVGTLVFSSNGGTTLVVPGEGTWTVETGGVIRFTPEPGFQRDPAAVAYSITDVTGDTASANVSVAYVPAAADDARLDNPIQTDVIVDVLANDDGDFPAGSVRLMDGVSAVSSLSVPGEGTWTVLADDTVRFHPLPSFLGDPSPVTYRVVDSTGDPVTAQVRVTYLPAAVDDHQGGLAIGSTATVPVLANDTGDWDTASLRIIRPGDSASVTSLTVAFEGTWTISGSSLVFTPAGGYLADPTPVGYRITDNTGDTAEAQVTLDYTPTAADDSSLGNALGTVVSLKVYTNDVGDFDSSTLGFGPGNVGIGASYTAPGEGTWEVSAAGVIRFTPLPAFFGDPTPVTYVVSDTDGDSVSALMTITYVPDAHDDASLGNAFGTAVNVAVLANDDGDLPAGAVRLVDGASRVLSLAVAGEGTWSVEADGSITFTPLPTFLTDPADVTYAVTDPTGDEVTAQIHITYLPLAVDDAQGGLAIGSVATVPVLANDSGDWDVSSLRLITPGTGAPATSVTIPGEGTWTVSGSDIVFTPQSGFLVDPSPIDYRITDSTGDDAVATVELDYGPGAADDVSLGNALGTTVVVSVFDNDSGSFDPATLGFGAGTGAGVQLVVPGEGTWEVLSLGRVSFTPEPGFLTDPTPVRYYADDVTGDPADALVTITYLPVAADDASLGNAYGSAVNVDVLANDTGDFATGTVRLLSGGIPVTLLTVPGEGAWTVEADDTVTFTPEPGFLTDPSDVDYQVTDTTGDVVSATVHVTYLPQAVDDTVTGLAIGTAPLVKVLTNDQGDWVIGSTRLVEPGTGNLVTSVTVAGQGTWTVSAGSVTFTPLPTFVTDPDPIDYQVTDTSGDDATATITLLYVPAAADDDDLGNVLGSTVDVSVFGNDSGSFDDATLGFGAGTGAGTMLVVPGEGTWEVLAGGVIRFTPEPGFLTDPAPVRYYASDVTGDPVDALITVTYLPEAADDSDLGNVLGTSVNVDVLANDTGDWAAGTVRLMDGILPVMTLTVAGEGTWTVEADDTVTFAPEPGFLTDPAVVHYRVIDTTGDAASATITITYLPQATNNSSPGHAAGTTVNVNVLGNDTGSFVLNSIRIIDPGTNLPVATLTVAGEGEWRANSDGTITFVPEPGFYGDPTPIDYEVTDVTGDRVRAQLRVAYLPVAALNQSHGNALGAPAVVDPLANDTGTFDPTSVRIVDPGTLLPVTTLVVPGEGQWDVDTLTGFITFTPAPGYTGNPTSITYQVTDVTGDTVQAAITVTYLPRAVDDQKLGNPQGDPVDVMVLPNDIGSFAAGSARLLSGGAPTMTLTVPGEGTWHMNAAAARVTFTPLASFMGDPTPVPYRVTDVNGNQTSANITITYLHAAGLAYTGMEAPQQLAAGLGAIALGLIGVAIARLRRATARHRA